MSALTTYHGPELPAQPTELAKFIVIAQERAKSIRAEIQAIKRLEVAKEVYEQKLEEQDRLRELMLLAYQRMGEITRELPKDTGGRPSEKTLPSSGKSFEGSQKAKSDTIRALGLSTSQVNRFEKMAAHPDIVEEVIAESQAGATTATQGEVLRRIKAKEGVIDLVEVRDAQQKAAYRKIDQDAEALRTFRAAVDYSGLYVVTSEMLDSVIELDIEPEETLKNLDKAIQMLSSIKNDLMKRRLKRGKKNLYPGN